MSILNDVVESARTCRTCRHWTQSGSLVSTHGTCHAISLKTRDESIAFAAYYESGDAGSADREWCDFYTKPDFGCALHERKEP